MATRGNIILRDANSEIFLYNHYDSYINDGLGDMLEEFIWNYMSTSGFRGIKDIQELLINKFHPRKDIFEIKNTDCLHGDVEYIYIIELNSRNIPTLTVYSRKSEEAWDNGPEDYLNSWHKFVMINESEICSE